MNTLEDLSPRQRALLWAAVLSGVLLAMLDQTIVGTSMPAIVDDLGGGSWYVWAFTAYLVPATVLLPVFARLSDRYGRRRLLLIGMVLFLLGSTMCALAHSMAQIVVFRGVQGAGAAGLEALSFVLVTQLSGTGRRAVGQAALAGVMAVSLLGGPMIGGLLTDHLGWQWVFVVNLPVGVVAILIVARVLPRTLGRSESPALPLDVAGILVLTGSVGLVLVGLGQRAQASSWTEARTGGLVIAGLAGLALLVAVEKRALAPVIPLRILTDRVTGRLLASGATATMGLYACVLLLPRYYQQVRGATATESGLLVYPLLLGLLLTVNLGAMVILRRKEFRRTLILGNAAVAAGAVGFLAFTEQSAGVLPLLLMAVMGLGLGPALSGVQVAIGRAVGPRDLGAAMGTLLMGRQIGGAIAFAASEAVFVARLDHGASAETATGWAVCGISAAGACVAAIALLGLGRAGGALGDAGDSPSAAVAQTSGARSAPARLVTESTPGGTDA